MRQEITTTDLADFGTRGESLLVELLTAWDKQGLPEDFYDEEVRPMMNRNSGKVFLTNSNYQAAMMNGNRLEMWNSCGNCGHEGFEEDCQLIDDGCNECYPEQFFLQFCVDDEKYQWEDSIGEFNNFNTLEKAIEIIPTLIKSGGDLETKYKWRVIDEKNNEVWTSEK